MHTLQHRVLCILHHVGQPFCLPKVADLEHTVDAEEEVGRLDVSVHNTVGVHERNSTQQLLRERANNVLVQRSHHAQQRRHAAHGHVLKKDAEDAGIHLSPVDLDDVLVDHLPLAFNLCHDLVHLPLPHCILPQSELLDCKHAACMGKSAWCVELCHGHVHCPKPSDAQHLRRHGRLAIVRRPVRHYPLPPEPLAHELLLPEEQGRLLHPVLLQTVAVLHHLLARLRWRRHSRHLALLRCRGAARRCMQKLLCSLCQVKHHFLPH
mmetsp:Transcript_13712/g.31639  ORF Transcript_13712/g.31639 Transcript_13712/m.31639 type:complete len:265 (+) Transcript_13712:1804-2598(+)